MFFHLILVHDIFVKTIRLSLYRAVATLISQFKK